jgi:MFS transporter, PAT family, solute carrier family 33 (acetyl-CoA transportor), member 1
MGLALPRFIYLKLVAALDGVDDPQQHPPQPNSAENPIDGYQIVNALGVALAIPVFLFWLRPATLALQRAGSDTWKVS